MRKLTLIILALLGCSCGTMPGMQNPDIQTMKTVRNVSPAKITATLIPITPELTSQRAIANYAYRIAPSDVLNIVVWQHPEFSPRELYASQLSGLPSTQGAAGKEGYLVNNHGNIYFPLVGKLHVAGKTVDRINKELTKRLRVYLKHPELNVRVADFRGQKVYVFGEVMRPGFVPITDQPLSITDAISLSKGFDPNAADPGHIYVIRGNLHEPRVYWLNAKSPEALLLAEQFILKPHDILYVSSAPATRWNRFLNQLLPTIQTVWYTQAIINSN